MNRIFKGTLVLTFCMLFFCKTYAQDPVFSQYYSSSLLVSPCFAGITPNTTFGFNTRTQWKSITSPYVTQQFSIIHPFYKSGLTDHNWGGVGLSIYQDKAGDFGYKSLGVNLNGAYNLRISHAQTITFGLMMGLIQKQIDFTKLEWGTQTDLSKADGFNPGLPPDMIQSSNTLGAKTSFLDFGGGLMYYINKDRDIREKGKSIWIGYSAYHLNKPNESLVDGYTQRLQLVSKGLVGFEFTVGSRLNFSPNVLLVRKGKAVDDVKGWNNAQVNGGMYITYMLIEPESDFVPKEILLGGWYRLGDAYIATLGLVSNTYTIGFSYDVNKSGLKAYSSGKGAWEVSLKVEIPRKEKTIRYQGTRI